MSVYMRAGVRQLKRAADRNDAVLSEADEFILRAELSKMEREGWPLDMAVRYLILTEEVSPALDEKFALARMAEIRAEFEKYKSDRT